MPSVGEGEWGRDLVLPQIDLPGLVDAPWKGLPSLRSGKEMREKVGEENCGWNAK